jgi:hypothetical protein
MNDDVCAESIPIQASEMYFKNSNVAFRQNELYVMFGCHVCQAKKLYNNPRFSSEWMMENVMVVGIERLTVLYSPEFGIIFLKTYET